MGMMKNQLSYNQNFLTVFFIIIEIQMIMHEAELSTSVTGLPFLSLAFLIAIMLMDPAEQ